MLSRAEISPHTMQTRRWRAANPERARELARLSQRRTRARHKAAEAADHALHAGLLEAQRLWKTEHRSRFTPGYRVWL